MRCLDMPRDGSVDGSVDQVEIFASLPRIFMDRLLVTTSIHRHCIET